MALATLAFVGEFIRPDYEAPEAVYLMASGVVTAILAFNAKRAVDRE